MNKLDFPLKVFVYGTLKREGSNHDVMVRACGKFLCEAKTAELRKLIVTYLPFLYDGHEPDGYQVEGEIFEIPDERGLDKIDTLEGNGHFYLRRLDDFIELDSPKEHTAWVYYIMRKMNGEPRRSF
jgi:gamma-glutamylcyclotransferase (GGCT)/AIG2-like uncharacterized protein YtfP